MRLHLIQYRIVTEDGPSSVWGFAIDTPSDLDPALRFCVRQEQFGTWICDQFESGRRAELTFAHAPHVSVWLLWEALRHPVHGERRRALVLNEARPS